MSFSMPGNVLFVIAALGTGGAQRAIANMVNHWSGKGWRVTLLVLGGGEDAVFPIHPAAVVDRLYATGDTAGFFDKFSANVSRLASMRRAFRRHQPDVVISFQDVTNILAVPVAKSLGIPIVCSERTDPGMHRIGRFWTCMRSVVYPFADAVVYQTNRALAGMSRLLRKNGVVIPNPVPRPECEEGVRLPVVCSLGRLSPEKGYGKLIEAFSLVARQYDEWQLHIIGEGDERGVLESAIRAAGLQDRVVLQGHSDTPTDFLRRAGVYALTSEYEGFPNALCEAMACGLPAVAFDCPSGPGEIIRHGLDGYLVPVDDVGGFAEALSRLMGGRELREEMGAAARQVVERFSEVSVMERWEKLLARITGENS